MVSLVTLLWVLAADQGEPPPPPPPTPDSPDFDAAQPPPLPPGLCEPACRKGYLCVQGQCVSVCNPPCAVGERCMENGECLPSPPGPAPVRPGPALPAPALPEPPPRAAPRARAPPAPKPPEPEPPSVFAMHLNLADVALWGLTGAIDFLVFEKVGVFIEARAANAGVLSYFDVYPLGPGRTHGFRNNYSTSFENGLGVALGAEKFFGDAPGLRGPYLSAGFELLEHRMKMNEGSGWNAGALTEWFLVPHARAGMRWRGGAFLFALGVRVGAGFMLSAEYSFESDAVRFGASRRVFLDAGLVLDLGFFLR